MTPSNDRNGWLGILWALYGISRLVISLVPNPFALMADFHLLYVVMILWNIVSGITALVAAADLLARRRSARSVAILAGFIALPVLPFGIMLGVYTLFVFLPLDRARA